MIVPSVPKGPCLEIAAAFLGIAWLTLALRVYTRLVLVKKWYAEDSVMVGCLLLYTIFGVATVETARLTEIGKGVPIPVDDVIMGTTWFLLVNLFYILTTLFLKFSIGLFFIRVAVNVKWSKSLIGWLLVVLTVISLWAFFLILFHCGSFNGIRDLILKRLEWKCAPPDLMIACVYSHAGIVAIVDWAFFILPFFILRKANIDRREKWIIGPLMMLASVGGIASLVRFKYCAALGIKGVEILPGSANLNIWSTLEASIGVSAANAACLRPMFRRHVAPLAKYIRHSISHPHSPFHLHEKQTLTNGNSTLMSKLTLKSSVSKADSFLSDPEGVPISAIPIVLDDDAGGNGPARFQLPKLARLPAIRLSDIEEAREEGDSEVGERPRRSWFPL